VLRVEAGYADWVAHFHDTSIRQNHGLAKENEPPQKMCQLIQPGIDRTSIIGRTAATVKSPKARIALCLQNGLPEWLLRVVDLLVGRNTPVVRRG
jgi:hypothetical protein